MTIGIGYVERVLCDVQKVASPQRLLAERDGETYRVSLFTKRKLSRMRSRCQNWLSADSPRHPSLPGSCRASKQMSSRFSTARVSLLYPRRRESVRARSV